MKKQQNNSTHVWALVVAFSIALLSVPVVLNSLQFHGHSGDEGIECAN
jgi:hypothetical protein